MYKNYVCFIQRNYRKKEKESDKMTPDLTVRILLNSGLVRFLNQIVNVTCQVFIRSELLYEH